MIIKTKLYNKDLGEALCKQTAEFSHIKVYSVKCPKCETHQYVDFTYQDYDSCSGKKYPGSYSPCLVSFELIV